MRLGIWWGLAVVVLGSFACKSESDPPVYLDAEYQLRCLDCRPRTADEPEREVALLDGEFDWRVECTVSRIGGKRSMNLYASYKPNSTASRYGFRIQRALIDSKDQSDECAVQVTEQANIYEGACSGDDPGDAGGCKVTFKPDGEIVNGTIYCEQLKLQGAPTSSPLYLVSPGTNDEPAKFAVHNCEGI